MKNKFFAALLAVSMIGAVAGPAMAEDLADFPEDPDTGVGEAVWTVIELPMNLVDGVTAGALGAVGGGFKRSITLTESAAQNTFGEAGDNPLMGVAGLVAVPVAIPIGMLLGIPAGAVHGAKYGWNMLDRLGDE